MNKEIKEEYDYWKRTIENIENRESAKQSTQKEIVAYSFVKGFVSAIDKCEVFKDN